MKADEHVIELEAVSVHYGRHQALHEVNLRIPVGATGLAGRNGAGKSTLLRLLLGLITPSSGQGRVLDNRLSGSGEALRRSVGYVPEGDAFLPGLRGVEQVALAGELCGLSTRQASRRAHEVLAYVDLGEARYRPVEDYSTGMRQRLKLAGALVHDPRLLLLDEPTVGMDPPGRERMLELIRDLARRHGKSVLLCTHLLGDIEHTCETVVIIEAGRVLAGGPLDDVLRKQSGHYRLGCEGDTERFTNALLSAGGALAENDSPIGRSITTAGTPTPKDGSRSTKVAEIRIVMPSSYDSRRFFHAAHESGVRLRSLRREQEDLTRLFHRLLREKAACDAEGTIPEDANLPEGGSR